MIEFKVIVKKISSDQDSPGCMLIGEGVNKFFMSQCSLRTATTKNSLQNRAKSIPREKTLELNVQWLASRLRANILDALN